MNISNDTRTIFTLDAGGTNYVFTAIKACQKIGIQQRFSAAEGHATAAGQKVQLIDFNALIQLLGRQHHRLGICRKGFGIQTILTPKRTAVKAHKGSYTRAVGGQSMARNADKRRRITSPMLYGNHRSTPH